MAAIHTRPGLNKSGKNVGTVLAGKIGFSLTAKLPGWSWTTWKHATPNLPRWICPSTPPSAVWKNMWEKADY